VSRAFALCVLLVATAMGVAACGGGEDTSSRSRPPDTTPTPAPEKESADKPEKGAWGVAFGAGSEDLGIILFDAAGRTLYTFGKDRGPRSSCYGDCAKRWPPALTEGKPKARGEASSAMVGAAKRKDGTVQLVYANHPLYYYAGDKGGAEYNGQGLHAFGGDWYVIRPNGKIVGS
jgi:predicted lipoprotein with Yx(FWY)xxD motif/predicted small secreted protein